MYYDAAGSTVYPSGGSRKWPGLSLADTPAGSRRAPKPSEARLASILEIYVHPDGWRDCQLLTRSFREEGLSSLALNDEYLAIPGSLPSEIYVPPNDVIAGEGH